MRFLLSIYFLIPLGFSLSGWAQGGDNAPIIYDQFFKNSFLVNPANADFENKDIFSLSAGNRTLTGLFEGVNRTYVDINFGLKAEIKKNKSKNRNFHNLGALVINGRDGEIFQRNRIYGRYSWQMALSKKASFSIGFAAGTVNYAVASSQAGGGGSSFVPDASLGIWYLRKNFKAGLSYQQIFQSKLTPVNQPIQLANYFNFNANWKAELGLRTYLTTFGYIKYQENMPFYSELASILTFYRHFELGANYRHTQGIAVLVGLSELNIGIGNIRLMASYLVSTRNYTNVNENVLEFSLGYSLLRK